MPRLDRRLESLEERLPRPRGPIVIQILPMMRPGRVFVPSAFSLRSGDIVTRGPNESQASFEARVSAAALASSSPAAMVFSADGDELPEA